MTILDTICRAKREEVEAEQSKVSLADVKAQSADQPPTRGFRRALIEAENRPALIAEVKKASPVAGTLRTDFDPVAIAEAYVRVGAHCLSVLTDRPHFQGSPEYLVACRAAVPVPVLRKDFIVDAYQIYEARAMGADAILLIVYCLSPQEIADFGDLARSLGMDVLVEVHTEAEAEVALASGADLIGVNNRDLHTFETNIEASEQIIPMIKPHAVAVSESALHTPEAVRRVADAGADAVLIGSAFSLAGDIEGKVREVMAWG